MSTRSPVSPFVSAVAIILLAILLFDIMGAIIKFLGDRYSPQQLSVFRNLFGLVPSFLVLWYSKSWQDAGRPLAIERWKLALLRGLFVTGAQYCFYLALTKMEFATATAIAFSGPLFVSALSVPLLGLQVGLVRWVAVFAGFAGVILVMQPASDVFNWYAVLPVIAAFGYACNSVSAKLFRASTSTALINLYSLVSALAGLHHPAVHHDRLCPHHYRARLDVDACHGNSRRIGGLLPDFRLPAYRTEQPVAIRVFRHSDFVRHRLDHIRRSTVRPADSGSFPDHRRRTGGYLARAQTKTQGR